MAARKIRTIGPRVPAIDLRRVVPAEKTAAPFYLTPEWRALMDRLIRERGRRCEKCGRTGTRIFGDHIVEIQDGGALLDPNNIQLLDGRCHTLKTNQARKERLQKAHD